MYTKKNAENTVHSNVFTYCLCIKETRWVFFFFFFQEEEKKVKIL